MVYSGYPGLRKLIRNINDTGGNITRLRSVLTDRVLEDTRLRVLGERLGVRTVREYIVEDCWRTCCIGI